VRVRGSDDLVTKALKLHRHVIADLAVVLDAQDGFIAAVCRQFFVPYRTLQRTAVGFGQIDQESRATTVIAPHVDAAARLLGESKHHAEPKPGAAADLLGGKERIENP